MLGAATLVATGLLPWRDAAHAVGQGTDVYLFLTGMMLLSEVARREGMFDWLAVQAVRAAAGSTLRLFLLIYLVGTGVTVLLSNDATAVVLTPAVIAATRAARVEPLPYLLICAFVANAASFVLPISNPANLVLYGSHMPTIGAWLGHFLLPSILSIAATLAVMLLLHRAQFRRRIETDLPRPRLAPGASTAAIGIGLAAVLLLAASAKGWTLGPPTALAGALTVIAVLIRTREQPARLLAAISWPILPLVAGLFVLVQGLQHTGLLQHLAVPLRAAAARSVPDAAAMAGMIAAVACSLINNLPAGLIARAATAGPDLPRRITDALLIGVDLGPNLSITGSLATILWLTALRREGIDIGFLAFLRQGALVMPPALLLALAWSVAR